MPDPRDPRGLRGDAPLLDAWLTFTAALAAGTALPFTIPGHKQRTGLVGDVVAGDVPLYGGLAPVKLADALLAGAERRAASLWGADWCRFGVGGSTHGNQALALAAAAPGDEVILSRTLHRSLLSGLVLAGLRPVWVRPDVDAATGLPSSVPVAAVVAALAAHPQARAVFVGDPSYVGTLGDVPGLAAAAHAAGVPLIVDAAWAPHFGFGPSVPPHALALGADALVTSAHKMLPSPNQAALVMARTGRLDADRLERAFATTHTTSPSGSALAGIDAARALLSRDGDTLNGALVELVAGARARLRAVPGLDVLHSTGVDPTKLVVLTAGTGAHGHALEHDLLEQGISLEMADRDVLVPVVSFADDPTSVTVLVDALVAAVGRHRGAPRPPTPSAAWTREPEVVVPPREAFFAPHETVGAQAAIGRISAETVAPYPPGIPVLAPGERITAETVRALCEAHADGVRIAYAADPGLSTLQVLVEP